MVLCFSSVLSFAFFSVIVTAKECDVVDYGAKGDGIHDDTSSIQKAIDDCSNNNSEQNMVSFPSNKVFLTYPIVIGNNTELSLGINTQIYAKSSTVDDIKSWPLLNGNYQPLISMNKPSSKHYYTNITITGNDEKSSIINGNGALFWELWKNGSLEHNRPHLMNIYYTKSLEINTLTAMDAGSWHLSINNCDGVIINNINISSPNYGIAPETDGIDIGSKNVHIYNCYVSNGDDSFTLKSGADNVLIENSTCAYPGNGIVIGTGGNIQNVIFRNMIADGTQRGIHLKAKSGQNGFQQNISFYNITFNKVLEGIELNNYNQSIYKSSNVTIQNIILENIVGTYQEYAGHIDCEETNPCHGLKFENINLFGVFSQSKGWQCSDNVYGQAINVSPALTCLHKEIR